MGPFLSRVVPVEFQGEEGSLFVCHPSLGVVFVFKADGTSKARNILDTPGVNLTNCCLGVLERKTLYITDSL